MRLIQRGNRKLSEAGMYMFNLPAIREVCSMECAGCYAIREQKVYKQVLQSRMYRYEASKKEDFAVTIISELAKLRKKPKYFRVHASGEFYSQKYINDWIQIAAAFPEIIFYSYTKRLLHFDFTKLQSLSNFILINSMQYKRLNYGREDKAPKGAFICPAVKATTVVCGVTCTYCMDKKAEVSAPYFIKH